MNKSRENEEAKGRKFFCGFSTYGVKKTKLGRDNEA